MACYKLVATKIYDLNTTRTSVIVPAGRFTNVKAKVFVLFEFGGKSSGGVVRKINHRSDQMACML
jgi:hypothetical protein